MAKIQDYLPKIEATSVKVAPTYVTPYLSDDAKRAARDHKAKGKPVFIKAMQHNPNTAGYCKNCGGGRFILLNMIDAGPFKDVPGTKKSITWFDGDGINGVGWYIIERSATFPCPECVK